MSNKLVFLDIDGTIVDHNKEIPGETKKSIARLQADGVEVAIATGRAPFMFAELREELGIHSYISFNGQYVVHDGEVIYENPLLEKDLEALYTQAYETGHPMVFLNEEGMRASVEKHHHISESIGSLKFPYPDIDPDYYKGKSIYQALLFCQHGEEGQYKEQPRQLDFIRWHEYSIDVIPRGGSKAEGIKHFMEVLGVEQHNTYAFGDGLNDREMLGYVANGIAMGNASDEIKAVANYVTKDVSDNGLSHGFRLVGLLHDE
ncbi:Cof-type HAD-IIB family hydrolase [Pontibacillus salipaludis]|uniref:Phosphatase n=1 Tax=Pontibacillus salipaludis TaxID=1697394 RepID=A0ABQ1Q9I3_9BACI|nr:Cof-type HAD-IIB family hydrolase [Pontibacillus salipaludis]GGD19631.1 phosphatase [Pontibacillus salipaludis]